MKLETGLDRFAQRCPEFLRGARVGLLVHPASISQDWRHAVQIFGESSECCLSALFGPQHGIRGETQDNMIEWSGFTDPLTGLPVYSLYGEARCPQPAMLEGIDALVIDLQDVGARYYTFIWTMELCMQACLAAGKMVVVLDRPNPVGGIAVEGNILDPAYASFVGQRPLPMRHGMTIAEIARYLQGRFYPELHLEIVPLLGWRRSMGFEETGLPWILPSPNMPTVETALTYSGMCLLEGTQLSEGRGTTRPFEIFGAPYIDANRLVNRLSANALPGVCFRPLCFEPTFQKHAGKLCGGAQLHVLDRQQFQPVKTAVAILQAIYELYPAEFRWKEPPYEYEWEKLPFDILAGTDGLRADIENATPLSQIEAQWQRACDVFDQEHRQPYLLYAD